MWKIDWKKTLFNVSFVVEEEDTLEDDVVIVYGEEVTLK